MTYLSRFLAKGAAVALSTFLFAGVVRAQDTTMVQGGIYQRPYIATAGQLAIGGYAEANLNWFRTDGVSEGLSMELRRFNIFLYSALGARLRFTAEIEFEHGAEEIAIETALLDYIVTPSFVLRAGVLLVPIGAFNVGHDAPRYEFVDRPLVSTRIIPSTYDDIGFGAHGRLAPSKRVTLSYDVYAVNGLGDGVITNGLGRTDVASGKDEERFGEDNNGSPAIVGRIGIRAANVGEVGLSHYRGAYNSFKVEGASVAPRRNLSLSAIDVTSKIGRVSLQGEAALAQVQVPADLRELFATRQWGAYLDAVAPVWHPRIRGLTDAVVNVAARVEHLDMNVGTFASTGLNIYDGVNALSLGVGFRPVAGTVFRANYRYEVTRDMFGNPSSRTGGFQLGFASYF